ncbi:thiopeptide-type bacteriocin biosynthesis protein [Ascidiimonas aurantiaca]|uniref:thiopeptide-type bacteriocin biosynthesis protein n=1 Tax=Ascidiimonas aurantiaca TaxID=1685432 RepID=UPI0030EF123F
MEKKTQRNFILGDEWLYYKIYTGPKTSDLVLTEIIKPSAEKLLEENIITQWFFIRYADPKHHIRVRFKYAKPEGVGVIINNLYPYLKQFVEEDLIWKLQIDTYQRELERYGDNTIDLGEELFFYDSKMITDFLSLIEGDEGEELRWLFGLRSIDNLLDSFEYTDDAKLTLLDRLKTGFGNEFGMSRPLKKQLDDKFRKEREQIEHFMVFTREENEEFSPIIDVLDEKTQNTATVAQKILQHQEKETLKVELDSLMGSYIHMLMNRLFKSNNRLHEMVCYDFLYRYYRSMIARKKKKQKSKTMV